MNFTGNPHYRGLGLANLRWMLTTALGGHWTPLTWLTLGLDYVLWDMDPFGYHLVNVLVHAVNAALFFLVADRLLGVALPEAHTSGRRLGAVAASLFFALHPLRAESVAWISERRDVLSGLFYLLTALAYLTMVERDGSARRRWYVAALALYALALLSKSMVVSLPLVLLVLDVYPLGRFGGARGWLTPAGRQALLEKVPFVGLALAVVGITLLTMQAGGNLTSLDHYPAAARLTLVGYSLAFYVWKTVIPANLSPLYEVPWNVRPTEPAFVAAGLAVLGITVACLLARRRWPPGLAVWLAYVLTVAPVSGIVQAGPQLVADRYSYLAVLGVALLVGGGVAVLVTRAARGDIRPTIATVAVAAVGAWILALAGQTVAQVLVWRNDATLWQHALDVDPSCGKCNVAWAKHLERSGEAEAHLRRAIQADPRGIEARLGLVALLLRQDRREEAEAQLQQALASAPDSAEALAYHGLALSEQGRETEALHLLERAVALAPSAPRPRFALARVLRTLGRDTEAQPHVEALYRLDPGLAERLRRR
jgi:hypothetical protein